MHLLYHQVLDMRELMVVSAESLVRNFREIQRSHLEEEGVEPSELLQSALEVCAQVEILTADGT